jgi:predicted TIM-barrel enzyme/AraC-like DNA-binding protein
MTRDAILKNLNAQINVNGHILGAAVGSGMTAKYTAMGGADFLLALSAGKYRIMGRSSFASYFCYGSNNEIVMELGRRELLPMIKDIPVLFGMFASDPDIHLYEYLKEIRANGFAGIVNFPTLAIVDGKFREALEEEGNTFDKEVEAIKIASVLDMFTVAFVTNGEEARKMLAAGADIICVHLGLTKGGFLGAKKYISLDEARKITSEIFAVCNEKNPAALKMIYAGPASTPLEMQHLYQNTDCQGYIGGSTFERIPAERAILDTMKSFKSSALVSDNAEGGWRSGDYVEFIRQYVADNYARAIQLGDLALFVHLSASYLSTKFKKEMGMSFTEYLIRFRMGKAKALLKNNNMPCREIAENVGYPDYAQFSKTFKKYVGISPTEYQKKGTRL